MMPFQWMEFEVLEIFRTTPKMRTLRLKIPEGKNFDFKPGQFVNLKFPDETAGDIKGQFRPFSISSSPLDKGYIEISLKKGKEFSTKIFEELKKGQKMLARGPFGIFSFDEKIKKDIVCIGGGTGIAPMRSIIRYVWQKKLPNNANVMYSCKKREEIAFYDEFSEIEKSGKIRFLYTLTEKWPADWQGKTGRINREMIKEFIPDMKNKIFYICGPQQMIIDVGKMLRELGVDAKNIKMERWG